MTWPPTAPGEGLQVMNFAHCLHIVLAIVNYKDILEGGGANVYLFPLRSFCGGREFSIGEGAVFPSVI